MSKGNADQVRRSRPAYSVALGTPPRGAGLGNEVIAWCKAYIGARELGLKLLKPAWAMSRYRLFDSFGWSRASLIRSEVLARGLPRIHISEERYRQTGMTDYGDAVKQIFSEIESVPGRPFTVTHEGMWGGYASIKSARNFLRQQFLSSPGVTLALDRAFSVDRAIPTIGIHVRRGDFSHAPPGPGEFNRAVPQEWYLRLIDEIDEICQRRVRFLLCSDAKDKELRAFLRNPRVSVVRGYGSGAALQELVVLSETDALMCSVSSFSMLAAFLSQKPYFWFRSQLSRVDGQLTLWGSEAAQKMPMSATRQSIAAWSPGVSRGIPWEEGHLPDWLAGYLSSRAGLREGARDLIQYGVVPETSRRGFADE